MSERRSVSRAFGVVSLLWLGGFGCARPSGPAVSELAPPHAATGTAATATTTPTSGAEHSGAPAECLTVWGVTQPNTPPVGLRSSDRYGAGPADPKWHDPAPGWALPAGVRFDVSIVPATVLKDTRELLVQGTLHNTTTIEQEVYLKTPHLTLTAMLRGDGIVFRSKPPKSTVTRPPEVLPDDKLFVIPPGARWRFETIVELQCWTHTPGQKANVYWSLPLGGTTPLTGEIAMRLP